MKRTVALLLAVLLSATLCGCSRQQDSDDPETSIDYTKYETLIQMLEAHDFDGARDEIAMLEESVYQAELSTGTYEEIVISAENWDQYFKVAEITEWCQNDMGETTGFVTHVCIALKPDYAQRIVTDRSAFSFQWQATCSTKNCDVDLENKIINMENVFQSNSTTFGDSAQYTGTAAYQSAYLTDSRFADHAVVAKIGEIILIGEYSYQGEMKPVCYDYDDTTIIDASGTLVLSGEKHES